MSALNQASSKSPDILVIRGGNILTRRTALGLNKTHGGSTDVVLWLIDNIIRLLENIGRPLINRSISNLVVLPKSACLQPYSPFLPLEKSSF